MRKSFFPCLARMVLLYTICSSPVAAQGKFPAATLQRAQEAVARVSVQPPRFQAERYNPAVLHLRFTSADGKTTSKQTDSFLDITLISPSGEPEGIRAELSLAQFRDQLKQLYRQLSRQDDLKVNDPQSPTRQLHNLLFGGITPLLQRAQISTLLIAADRGLQAVPFAALSDGNAFFGDRFAFSLTPSLALTDLGVSNSTGRRLLALGASEFEGLAALPLVPQELDQISVPTRKDAFLNKEFTPERLLDLAGDPDYNQLHIATHAEFKPGGPAASQLHSGVGPMTMQQLTALRQSRKGFPLDLVVFSACRTALGDADAELGFSGLALQAGAKSAVGTLWYVDDVVTSAYFVQMYRYLDQGIPKAEAMQMTRQAFIRGLVRTQGNQVVGDGPEPLLTDLTTSQRRRLINGVANPFFWAGIELMGTPW
jgi:CHAT domain-containing protein